MRTLPAIKSSSFRVRFNLREVHIITQWKDGCIYRTRSLGMIVCHAPYADRLRVANPNIIIGPVSTDVTQYLHSERTA